MDGNILNAFATLSLVVVALGALLLVVKKTTLNKASKDQILDMKILSKMQLNPKNHLYVVQAGDKRLLLGVSESGIRSLSELSDVISSPTIVNKTMPIQQATNPKSIISNDESLSFKSFLKSTFSVKAS